MEQQFTPKQLTAYLNEHIIGQEEAKKAIAIAVRNRYRRMQLPAEIRKEIVPKNIMMIGPTGVGKTEIARRIATFIHAPFVKVEATKFTEVGYVGRDVESIIRDLIETSVRIVKDEMRNEVQEQAKKNAEKRLINYLMPKKEKKTEKMANPFEMLFGQQQEEEEPSEVTIDKKRKKSEIGAMLRIGKLEEELVEIDVPVEQSNVLGMMTNQNNEQMNQIQDMLSSMVPKQSKKKEMLVKEARVLLEREEADKLLDDSKVAERAVQLTEQSGIVFIDEIDKIASRTSGQSADVSREGVQRDILPIVEGSAVQTKYGVVHTDHILFIAAGAFHVSKPSDIIPELQGRFPIRVELNKLQVDELQRILTEPKFSLLRQYEQMLSTEEVTLTFTEDAIEELARVAFQVNETTENIGARRLHTILEKVLEELQYEASDMGPSEVQVNAAYVQEKVGSILKDDNLSHFIL